MNAHLIVLTCRKCRSANVRSLPYDMRYVGTDSCDECGGSLGPTKAELLEEADRELEAANECLRAARGARLLAIRKWQRIARMRGS